MVGWRTVIVDDQYLGATGLTDDDFQFAARKTAEVRHKANGDQRAQEHSGEENAHNAHPQHDASDAIPPEDHFPPDCANWLAD